MDSKEKKDAAGASDIHRGANRSHTQYRPHDRIPARQGRTIQDRPHRQRYSGIEEIL